MAYLVGVVQIQKPVLALVNVLVARVGATDHEGSIHVHVVAGEVNGNQTLEENSPSRESGRQEDEEAGGGAAISDHVKHGTKASRLFENSGSIAIDCIEQTGDAIQEGTCSRVDGHVV